MQLVPYCVKCVCVNDDKTFSRPFDLGFESCVHTSNTIYIYISDYTIVRKHIARGPEENGHTGCPFTHPPPGLTVVVRAVRWHILERKRERE